jgi:4-aminobutyrate aminotransferase
MGSLSLTASRASHRARFSPLIPEVHHVAYGLDGLKYLEEVVFRYEVAAEEVAAVFVEPIQGEGGYVVPPAEFLPRLSDLCRRHGILLVLDEIQSGFGRTGKMFACEHWNIEPDILCVAKGIASGMPLGAMIARDEISVWTRGTHGTTFGGNPVACAAALATIEIIQAGLVKNAAETGAYLKDKLDSLRNNYSGIGDVRGLGLMIGVDFRTADGKNSPNAKLRDAVMLGCFERGLLILNCGESTLRFCPPLTVTRDDVDAALAVFEDALKSSVH